MYAYGEETHNVLRKNTRTKLQEFSSNILCSPHVDTLL